MGRLGIRVVTALLITMGCSGARRLPNLEPGFWRQDGAVVAQAALTRGDSGLIVLVLPDSTWLAFKQPINLEMNTERDIYHIAFGDLGIDSVRLETIRDSINTFLQAYNFRKIAIALE